MREGSRGSSDFAVRPALGAIAAMLYVRAFVAEALEILQVVGDGRALCCAIGHGFLICRIHRASARQQGDEFRQIRRHGLAA